MDQLDRIMSVVVDWVWGPPLLVLLLGGGVALTFYSRMLPFFRMGHAVEVLRGRLDRDDDPGQISHFQALSTHLAATVGLGNIGGVAIAITQGGPGAVFWMWMAALVGMATKFFTCTLAILYRRRDAGGEVQGGPMYYIELGMGPRFRFLAVFFSICGLIGCLTLFQANQMAEILKETYQVDRWVTGAAATLLSAMVILGGLGRIASVSSRLVPVMCLTYLVGALLVVVLRHEQIFPIFAQIFHDAFNGTAAAGGAAGISIMTVVQTGVKRAAFSNEAGIGTAPLIHGAARTTEAVREGLVAMIGPLIDTLGVCSLTAVVILSSGNWQTEGVKGVSLTLQAFESSLGSWGSLLLVLVVLLFGMSTILGYSYYGKKCFIYLFGPSRSRIYDLFYLAMLSVGAVWNASLVVNVVDTAFALMAFPNMIAVLFLAPRVMQETRAYFARQKSGGA